jgi:hypothetical protein
MPQKTGRAPFDLAMLTPHLPKRKASSSIEKAKIISIGDTYNVPDKNTT